MLDFISQKGQKRLWGDFSACFTGEAAEEFLQTLLNLMKIIFVVNHDYRRNIEKFSGRYQFLSEDGRITVAAVFDNGRLEVKEEVIANPDIAITFRDGRTLMNFIMSPRQDILGSMLRHDVTTRGNLNYLYRFGFLAKELQLMMPPP